MKILPKITAELLHTTLGMAGTLVKVCIDVYTSHGVMTSGMIPRE